MCLQTSPLAGLFCVAARMKSLMRTGHDLPNVVGYMFQYVVESRCHLPCIAVKQGEHKIPGILRVLFYVYVNISSCVSCISWFLDSVHMYVPRRFVDNILYA